MPLYKSTKKCYKCKEEKPPSEFYKNKNKWDYLENGLRASQLIKN